MEITYNDKNELELPVFCELEKNIDALESMFADWGDIVRKKFVLEREEGLLPVFIIYIDGLTDNEMVERTITRPFLYEWRGMGTTKQSGLQENADAAGRSRAAEKKKDRMLKADDAMFQGLFHAQAEAIDLLEMTEMKQVIGAVLRGDTAIFVNGVAKAMVLSTKKLPTRAVNFPQKEAGLKGPRDSFLENFRTNTALIRRRIKDPKMKLKQGSIGQRSQTIYGLMYMEDLVYPSLLQEIEQKLDSFTIDGIFDSGMLVHLLEEKWYSPFPQVQTTERPDKAASAIMEGRVVLVVDN